MINFVIPSIGRKTLKYSLQSLLNQTNSKWKCTVGFDGLKSEEIQEDIILNDERINYLYLKDKLGKFTNIHGNAGFVRNYIISNLDDDCEWIAFLDDDDTVTEDYVDLFYKELESKSFDCCVFRMRLGDRIVPSPDSNTITLNDVGISFVVNKNFLKKNNLQFENSDAEDYFFLKKIESLGGNIIISEHITYNVNMIDTSTVKKKLKDIGPILWINLDTETDRQKHMTNLFDMYDIKNVRISAIDARHNDVSDLLVGRYPELMTQSELGCTLSHLKAIKYFYEETDLNHIIICEDDIVFDTVQYWPFTWNVFMAKAPYDWDVLQCAITSTKNLRVNLHPRLINDFCAAFYVITRHHAEKILKNHIRGDKFRLDQKLKPRAVSEELIYNSGRTYSIPLFTYRYDFNSGIHQDHIEIFHKQNVDGIMNFWKTRSPDMTTDILLDYDYYAFWEPLVG